MQSLNSYVAARQLEDRRAFASMTRAARRGTSKGSDGRPPRPRFRLRVA
jgi:hypothetical protein